jgi:hypothetical protein
MKHTSIIVAVGLALAGVLPAAPLQALLGRTFVSSQGSDVNDCSRQFPCRHLQAALAATNAGGEIAVLDTGGFNSGSTVTIDKAISIVNPGGFEAGIIVPSAGTGIVINAGASDAVSLRGLTIEGGGTGSIGIGFNSGQSLTVQNCVIRHMNSGGSAGINFVPTASSSLFVSHTIVSDNGLVGIFVLPSGSGAVSAVFNDVEANNNAYGILVNGIFTSGTIKATATGTVAAGNALYGFYDQAASGTVTFMLDHAVVANNAIGVYAYGTGTTVRLYQSMVTGNANGWDAANSAVVQSYGNNSINGNVANEAAPTSVGLK